MDGKLAHAVFTDVPPAICVAVRSPERQSPSRLVQDGRWRNVVGTIQVVPARIDRADGSPPVQRSADGSLHFHRIDWRHLQDIQAAAEDIYRELMEHGLGQAERRNGLTLPKPARISPDLQNEVADGIVTNSLNLDDMGGIAQTFGSMPEATAFLGGRPTRANLAEAASKSEACPDDR